MGKWNRRHTGSRGNGKFLPMRRKGGKVSLKRGGRKSLFTHTIRVAHKIFPSQEVPREGEKQRRPKSEKTLGPSLIPNVSKRGGKYLRKKSEKKPQPLTRGRWRERPDPELSKEKEGTMRTIHYSPKLAGKRRRGIGTRKGKGRGGGRPI